MPPSLRDRASDIYRREGLWSLLRAAGHFGSKQALGRALLLEDTAAIRSRVSRVVDVSGRTASSIAYDGQWPEPHPAQIEVADGAAVATPRTVYEFGDAAVVGSRPVIEIDRQFVVPSSIGPHACQTDRLYESLSENVSVGTLCDVLTPGSGVDRTLDSAFLLTGRYTRYGHWTYEILPKLRVYEAYTQELDRNPVILTGPGLTDWQRESLTMLGYPSDAIQEKASASEHVHVERLAVPSHRFLTSGHAPYYPSVRDLCWVRSRVRNAVDGTGRDGFGDRIYVSRADADQRQVRNRDAVLSIVSEYGFDVYEPGRFSFADQVRLFAGADTIVGPFGAGISNVVFAEDADIVELLASDERNLHHYVLASLLALDYEYVECTWCDQPHVTRRNRDVIVDTAALRDVLETVC